MNKKQLILLFLILAVSSIFLAGCSMNPFKGGNEQDHKKGEFEIATVTPRYIYFTRTHAHLDGDHLVVWGRVRLRTKPAMTGGHVDIEVLDPAGKVLTSVSEFTVPRVVHKEDKHGSVFKVRLPIDPPVGSSVKLTFHKPEQKKARPLQH